MTTKSRQWTVVLATAGLLACGGKAARPGDQSADGGDGGDTGGASGQGGSGGAGGTGGSAVGGSGGSAGGGGTGAGPTGGSGGWEGDPVCGPYYHCDSEGSSIKPEAALDGSTLTIRLRTFLYYESWEQPIEVEVEPALGTLVSSEVQGDDIVILVELAPGATGGDIVFDGVRKDECSYGSGEVCDVHRTFHVDLADGGQPAISRRLEPERALELRPRVKLALVETGDAWARVRALGAVGGATVRFEAAQGTLDAEGAEARWSLPGRPGLYQLEVVVQKGGAIATDAVIVEVRPARRGA